MSDSADVGRPSFSLIILNLSNALISERVLRFPFLPSYVTPIRGIFFNPCRKQVSHWGFQIQAIIQTARYTLDTHDNHDYTLMFIILFVHFQYRANDTGPTSMRVCVDGSVLDTNSSAYVNRHEVLLCEGPYLPLLLASDVLGHSFGTLQNYQSDWCSSPNRVILFFRGIYAICPVEPCKQILP